MRTTIPLINTLVANKVLLCDYKPAYDGESVGLDLYNTSGKDIVIPGMALPTPRSFSKSTLAEFKKRRVKTLIPTGLHLALPRNHVALLRERGSITKTPLVLRAGVIDPGYTGEIFVNMVNTSDVDWIIPADAKLPVQLIVVPAITDFQSVTQPEYEKLVTESTRGTGQIGSSD